LKTQGLQKAIAAARARQDEAAQEQAQVEPEEAAAADVQAKAKKRKAAGAAGAEAKAAAAAEADANGGRNGAGDVAAKAKTLGDLCAALLRARTTKNHSPRILILKEHENDISGMLGEEYEIGDPREPCVFEHEGASFAVMKLRKKSNDE
jgi:hypothetical protein